MKWFQRMQPSSTVVWTKFAGNPTAKRTLRGRLGSSSEAQCTCVCRCTPLSAIVSPRINIHPIIVVLLGPVGCLQWVLLAGLSHYWVAWLGCFSMLPACQAQRAAGSSEESSKVGFSLSLSLSVAVCVCPCLCPVMCLRLNLHYHTSAILRYCHTMLVNVNGTFCTARTGMRSE